MRIALLAHHVAPLRPPFVGGVEAVTWSLADWLARAGHDVTCFAPPGSAVPGVEVVPLDLRLRVSDRARADVSMPPEAFLQAHHAYLRALNDLAASEGEYDLVHSNTLHYLPVALASLVRAPVLLTLHTPPTPWLESSLRAGAPDALRINAVSRATAEMWSRVVAVDDVIPNGVDLDRWPAGPGGDDAVWTGRIVPEKAPHLAVDAARRAGLRIRLAGPILDRGYFERELAPRLGPDATHVGHLDHGALGELVGSSLVAVVSPVWDEPFGLVAAEAMACGTPVAAFDRGGLRDVIGDDGGRLAAPSDGPVRTGGTDVPDRDGADVAGLAQAIAEAAQMDRRGVRAAAQRRLGVDAMGRGYERLYGRIAYEHRPVAAAP